MKKLNILTLAIMSAVSAASLAGQVADSSATGVAYFGKIFEKGGIDSVSKEIANCYKSASDIGFVEMCHGLDFAAGFATANNPQLLTLKNKDFFSIDSRVNRLLVSLKRMGVSGVLAENKSASWTDKSMAAFERIYMSK